MGRVGRFDGWNLARIENALAETQSQLTIIGSPGAVSGKSRFKAFTRRTVKAAKE